MEPFCFFYKFVLSSAALTESNMLSTNIIKIETIHLDQTFIFYFIEIIIIYG